MFAEIPAVESNSTWKITNLPEDKKAIGCMWVYKVKLKPYSSIDWFKAKLATKGYSKNRC